MREDIIIGIVSGYWNPQHFGHVEYIRASKARCEYLIAIVNNDKQVELKGSKKFLDERHRCLLMGEWRSVDEVFLSIDTDKHVCVSLESLRKKYPNNDMYFFNSGDRVKKEKTVSAETETCKKLGIKYVAIPLPKIYSSSELLKSII